MQAPPTPQGNSDDYHHGDADCDHDGGDIIMKKTSYRTG